ncbi:MAG TPA: ATPase, T2SS/T4P/T4SS family, partial [Opitutales bacterium]|nr:ATPase, T2SS/T4P/T4SS family [Opitutales bacterium]
KNLLSLALKSGSTDIHFELHAEQLTVRARKPSGLEVLDTVAATQGRAALTRLKLLAGMDIAHKPWPQEGRFEASVLGLGAAEFRASSLPIAQGESLVLRILRPDIPARGLESLGLSSDLLKTLWGAIESEEGLFLFTGPTGSGKTTTAYSLLGKLNDVHHKLVTVEDPVEYTLEGALQLNVQELIGLTFPEALKALLRHDPDTIMIGEIRDSQTAQIAVQAALTGHRVLATLHTPDAQRAIVRLIDLGVEPYLVAATLKGVLAQRLVFNPDAQSPEHALSAEFSWLRMDSQMQTLIASGDNLASMRQSYPISLDQ